MSVSFSLEFLGSGTSTGVPVIGCDCAVCHSHDPRNQRLRCAALVRCGETVVVLDTGPDFRTQMLRANVRRVDAVLLTHAHADHVVGLDDLRRFNQLQEQILDVWASPEALAIVRRAFGYAFSEHLRHGLPNLRAREARPGEPFHVGPLQFVPLALDHVIAPCQGFVITADGTEGERTRNPESGSAPAEVVSLEPQTRDLKPCRLAYCVDCKNLPEATLEALSRVDVLVLDMLRPQPHPTHLSFDEALAVVARVRPQRTVFTHVAHEVDHAETEAKLPAEIRLAYDGMVIECQ